MAETDVREVEPAGDAVAEETAETWLRKRVILIRHGRSYWNEFLGAHKKKCWEQEEKNRKPFRDALKNIVVPSRRAGMPDEQDSFTSEVHATTTMSCSESYSSGGSDKRGFWKGVRGGVKHVANAFHHADKLQQVDHSLSPWGMKEVRQLRRRVASLLEKTVDGSTAALPECEIWYISPFLRVLQTAAFALAPLYSHNPDLVIKVTPLLNELSSSIGAMDCQGKKGNVGLRVITRAMAKTLELLDSLDESLPSPVERLAERQAELAETTAAFNAMDIAEVIQVWWRETRSSDSEQRRIERSEDARVRQMVARLLKENSSSVGVVGHSMFFKRLLQLLWPKDSQVQEELRSALRNGAPADTKDPFHDKIMNCGILVLTCKYKHPVSEESCDSVEIVGAEFLFDGHMEDALSADQQTIEDDAIPETVAEQFNMLTSEETDLGLSQLESSQGLPQLESFIAIDRVPSEDSRKESKE